MRAYLKMDFEDGLGARKVSRGKKHTYLAMDLDYSHKGECRVTMYKYLDGILKTFDEAVKVHGEGWVLVRSRAAKKTAAPDNLFIVNEECKKLATEVAASFHTVVAKLLYVSKRARPDISLSVAFLTTRVRSPDIEDWVLGFLWQIRSFRGARTENRCFYPMHILISEAIGH
jgi:hypothetical protein